MSKRGDNTDRPCCGEGGFSQFEGLVVVAIMGIVVALGVLTMIKAPATLSDSTARARARQALATARLFYSDRGLWGQASEIQDLEPSVQFVDLDSDGPQMLGKVYVKVDGDVATLVSRSATGNCDWVKQARAGTFFAASPCESTPAASEFAASW